jgi:3-hydroxymyristoyl/3-hydroxydecanoyl-(acyl carrier protein) dehydratase
MQPAGQFSIAPDHPCLPGHFPGRPVVPGVVLLDEVATLVSAAHPGLVLAALPQVRFLAPVLPGQVVELTASLLAAGQVGFLGTVEGRAVLRGNLEFAPQP